MTSRAWRPFGQEFSIVLALGLCGLAAWQYLVGRPWWAIGVSLALASLDYRETKMVRKRLYTAWDNRRDEARLFRGLERLVAYGVKPDHIMVYMLIGYWPGETVEEWCYRQAQLRAFGCRPYPIPYVRTPATVGFQRWVVGAYDKRVHHD
jgi:hypothetical protein